MAQVEQRRSTQIVIWTSWVLLFVSIVGWPLTALTVAKGEPPFILGLSWFAIIYAAANTLLTAYTKRSAEEPSG